MDLDFGSDQPDEDPYDGDPSVAREDPPEDADQTQMDDDDESIADSNDADEESAGGATRSMRSSRSPEPMENEDEDGDTIVREDKPPIQANADVCSYYDLIPYIAAPQATHINCVVTTKNLRYFFTGGQDGYIRKHDFHQSITGKVPLTVAQKHAFVDTVQRSGVLLSYWENDECDDDQPLANAQSPSDKPLSPVYCLAVQSEALWMLSGQHSGAIKLQSVRVEEGKTIATLRGHSAPVSVLQLSRDERSLLSGGWDKQIYDWDLETGKKRRNFVAGNEITGQVSTIALRPEGASAIDMSNAKPPVVVDKEMPDLPAAPPLPVVAKTGSPASDISFDPLFDEEDEDLNTASGLVLPSVSDPLSQPTTTVAPHDTTIASSTTTPDGPEDVFLSSCIDGTMSIWDRRQSSAISRIPVPRGVPPWCMSACWSLAGDTFYCGRRNGVVEEYSMRSDMTRPTRTIKLPTNSGPVSSVTAMPNGRSLICASHDNVRIYDLRAGASGMPFLIVPGHHGGVISSFYVDPTCRYAFSTSGNRGWDGTSTEVLLGYEIVVPKDAVKL